MLKKIIISILMAAFAATTFAWDPHNPKQQQYAFATSNAKHGLWFTAVENFKVDYVLKSMSPEVTRFGYSYLNDDYTVNNYVELSVGNGTISNVKAGSMIGFWYETTNLETGKSVIYGSTDINNGEHKMYFNGREKINSSLDSENSTRVFAFEDGTPQKGRLGTIEFASPTGQPLPGALMSLMLVGATFYGMKKIRKVRNAQ